MDIKARQHEYPYPGGDA